MAERGACVTGVSFVPVVFEIPEPIDPSRATVQVTYPASDPGAVTTNGSGGYTLPSGSLRLWKRDGTRSMNTVAEGGDFLPSDTACTAEAFGCTNGLRAVTFYAEAVRPSAATADLRILFEVDPDGDVTNRPTPGFIAADAVRATALDFDVELAARDPESNDVYECSSLVLVSHPVPQIDIQTVDAELDGDAIEVSVAGMFTDRMSEISGERVGSISVMYDDEELDTIAVTYGGPGEMPWQPATSDFQFSRTYTLPCATPGTHIIRFIAGPNAAGEVGQAAVAVFVEEQFTDPQPLPPSATISIVFPEPPATNALDTAVVYFGEREPATNDLSVAETAGNPLDEYFAGHIWHGTNAVPFELFMCGPLSFAETTNDVFSAVASYVVDATNVIDIAATWRETTTNSLRFFPSEFFLLEPVTEPKIADAAVLLGTPPGFIEPFVARVRSSLPQEETEDLLAAGGSLSIAVAGQQLRTTSNGPDGDLYLSDTSGGTPRLFVALADDIGMVPAAAYEAHYLEFSLSDRSETVLRETGAHLIEPEVDDAVQPAPLGAMALAEGTPVDPGAWTIEQAWMWFRILHPKTGQLLKDSYTEFGGTVVKAELPGVNWKNYRIQYHTGEYNRSPLMPVITLDDDIPNAVEAGLALGKAMWYFDGSHLFRVRNDYNRLVGDILFDLMKEGDEVAQAEITSFQQRRLNRAAGELEHLGNAVEFGINVIPLIGGTLGFLIDTTKIESDISAGKFGTAGCTALFAVLGVIGDAVKAGEVIRIKGAAFMDDLSPAGRQAMETALTATTQKGKIASLRGALANGDINVDLVQDLYKSGFLKVNTKSAHYKLLQDALEAGGESYNRAVHIRHHDLPLQFELKFLQAGIDPDEWGRFLLKDLKTHKAFHAGKGWGRGGPWNYQWQQFFDATGGTWFFDTERPYESILEFMEELRRRTPEGAVTIEWPFKLTPTP